jgi:5'(3')-deoxyribonucleotidase
MPIKPRVLVDVDGVLADFSGATSRTLVTLGGTPFKAEDVTEWDLNAHIGSHKDEMYRAWRSKGWCSNIKPYPGAIEGIQKLQEVADVFYLTAPFYEAPHWAWERLNWLKQLMGATDYQVSFTHAKHIVQGDFMVEDRPKNIKAWADAHPDSTVVIWDQPYTRDIGPIHNSFRTRDWDALCKRVQDAG